MIRTDHAAAESRSSGSAETTTTAIATHGLTRCFGRETALVDVDLRIPRYAVFVLVGPNGAGKTTMMRLLMNLLRPTRGSTEVLEMDATRDGPRVRAQIGYVPERQDQLHRWMTCGRMLQYQARFFPMWDDVYAEYLSGVFELRLDRRIRTLSKGETRRLQLVLALAHRPPVLLLDEPTDGLDPVVRERALRLLAEHIADSPTTVLVSTHQVYQFESLADHLGVLSGGRLLAQMSRD